MNNDPALDAIIEHLGYTRKELVLWFFIMWLSFFILAYTVYQFKTVQTKEQIRSYVAVDEYDQLLTSTSIRKPSQLTVDEIESWMLEKIEYCMTFDYLNYAQIYNECNTSIFSLNASKKATKGEIFYRSLEDSKLIDMMITKKSAMNIDIDNSTFVEEGVKEYSELINTSDGIKTKVRRYYSYDFTVTFRVNLVNYEVDAPIVYDVRIERMSELNRKEGIAIRSVISRKNQ